MIILLEVFSIAVVALLISRLAPEPWRGRGLTTLKAWFTVRAFWLLLSHPITMEDGSKVVAWRLIEQQLAMIDSTTFWTFVLIATGIKMIGMLASMYRWVLVLRGQGIELPFAHIFGSFMIGRAIGTFLPSTAGLDGYTLYDASRFSGKTVEVAAAKFLEKICGFSGVFLTFLVSLPFGIGIFGENAMLFASISIPIAVSVITGLLIVLWFPGIVTWLIENLPIPAKDRLTGIVTRISNAASAYRDKKALMLLVLFMSFLVHFTTAVMYYFTALAIGAQGADFWQVTFGSSIQIFATVVSPFTIAGEGIREAAQLVLLGSLIGPAAAIVSAALGFWAAEAPTMLGFIFWWIRPAEYTPAYCRVNGVEVDFEEAAKAAVALESEDEKAAREARGKTDDNMDSLGSRVLQGAGVGLGSGVLAGILIGVAESLVIAAGGFGGEAQVLWYGPFLYAAILGGLAGVGGVFLGVLPMERAEIGSWVPALGLTATLIPFGLAIAIFRIKRDVYLEQMPPAPVLVLILAIAAVVAVLILTLGRKFFASGPGRIARPGPALGLLGLVMVLGFLASFAFGAGSAPAGRDAVPAALADRPNVILVMVDTLRADHLSCMGGDYVQTPNMCRLAAEGGSQYQGFAHASWTKPSTASLLTSLLPSTHGTIAKPSKLPEDVDLIAEVMQAEDYTTGGIVSNINLAESFGFDQGYDEYYFLGPDYLIGADESSSKLIIYNILRAVIFKVKPGIRAADFYQDSDTVNAVAFDWLERHAQDRFFLFLHYMDPHDPYFEHPYNGRGISRVSNQHPDAALAEEMHALYNGEIAFLDANFGKLLAHLESLDLYEDTVIALVADHGEEFFEHGGWWHGLTLYEEQIHVPMLFKWAKGQGVSPGATDGVARLIDVAPTLISASGGSPAPAMQGIDLRQPESARAEKDRQVFSEEDHEGNVLWSLRTETMKLISANEGNPRGVATRELFAVGEDPHEERPLDPAGNARVVSELERHAELQLRAAEGEAVESGGEAEMSLEECEQLRMLGYVEDCSHIAH